MAKQNMIDKKVNTTVSKAGLDMFVNSINDPNWTPVFKKSLQNCWNALQKIRSNVSKKYSGKPFNIPKDSCSYEAFFFANCFAISSIYVIFYLNHFLFGDWFETSLRKPNDL
jgi:hypothetical protein